MRLSALLPALALALALAPLTISPPTAHAVGPGGWDHLGTGSGGGEVAQQRRPRHEHRRPRAADRGRKVHEGRRSHGCGQDRELERDRLEHRRAARVVDRWRGSRPGRVRLPDLRRRHLQRRRDGDCRGQGGGLGRGEAGPPRATGRPWSTTSTPCGWSATSSSSVASSWTGSAIPTRTTWSAATSPAERSPSRPRQPPSRGRSTRSPLTGSGRLYAGGNFQNLEGNTASDFVAAFSAGTWSNLGAGAPNAGLLTGIVRSLASNGTDVFIGSDATDLAGIAQADHVARWNGTAWSALGAGPGGTNGYFPAVAPVYALLATGSTVYASGDWQNAGGDATSDYFAAFNGSTWSPLGSNGAGDGALQAKGEAVEIFANTVHAGGNFTAAGGDALASYVARYAPVFVPAGHQERDQAEEAGAGAEEGARPDVCRGARGRRDGALRQGRQGASGRRSQRPARSSSRSGRRGGPSS